MPYPFSTGTTTLPGTIGHFLKYTSAGIAQFSALPATTWSAGSYLFSPSVTVAVGDGIHYFEVPTALNGADWTIVRAYVTTVSTSGLVTVQIHNLTLAADTLSTALTIDANENSSSTAATPAVINGTYDSLVAGHILRFDVDTAGTGAKGLQVTIGGTR